MQKLPLTLFTAGCGILTISIFIWLLSSAPEIVLRNGSMLWEEFTKTNHDSKFYIYIFNVTNPKEIENGENPLLTELGPYVYRETRSKRIIEENVEKDTITYAEAKTYHFDENLSSGTEDDLIIVLNSAFVGVAQHLSEFETTYRWLALIYLTKFQAKVFERRSVGEFLFKGTYLPMIHEIQMITGLDIMPNATFGIFYGKNGTENGVREIYTGIKDPSKLGETISFNGELELNFWNDTYCNMINGTDATLFSPSLKKDSTLYIYGPEMCRSGHFTFLDELEIKGISAYRFGISHKFFESATSNPDNSCFCTIKSKCPKDGAFQLAACQRDAPVLVSFPHFLYGDEEYIEKFGFNPQVSADGSIMSVEPTTGILLESYHRIQLNVDVRRLPQNSKFKRIQDLLFPIIWMEEHYIISEAYKDKLKSGLNIHLSRIEVANTFALGCGTVLILVSLFIFWIRLKKTVFV